MNRKDQRKRDQEIVRLFKQGIDTRSLSERYNITSHQINVILKKSTVNRPQGRDTAHVRFWKKVRKGRGCWIWTGGKNNHGYGIFGPEANQLVLAHRFVLELTGIDISDQCVLHRCDNPSCVNPDHLFLGTKSDNTQDMIRKGRWKAPPILFGDQNGNSKAARARGKSQR